MLLPEYVAGRCINCGYLGKRDQDSTASNCYEASSVERLMGDLTKFTGMQLDYAPYERQIISTRPWCFINKAQFYQELLDIGAKEHDIIKVKDIISKDRKCPYWCEYKEGISPQEHYEEFRMMQLEENRRQFEEQMEQRRQEFDLKLFEISQKVQQDSKDILRDSKDIVEKSDKFGRKITFWIIVLAVAEVVGTLLALFFADGISC